MRPQETGAAYDRIAAWWAATEAGLRAGIPYVEQAIAAAPRRGAALDVGCGAGGRLLALLEAAGFHVTGLDVSAGMLEHARRRHPGVRFVHADVATWEPPAGTRYDLVLAWDSTFHLPRDLQEPVLRRLCRWLAPGGVLLATTGGKEGEVSGEMQGVRFAYSALAPDAVAAIAAEEGCAVELREADQPPAPHLAWLVRRTAPSPGGRGSG